jgi:hypothetical protein
MKKKKEKANKKRKLYKASLQLDEKGGQETKSAGYAVCFVFYGKSYCDC